MIRLRIFLIVMLMLALGTVRAADITAAKNKLPGLAIEKDTALLNQIYYNGKVWIGLYYNVYGTEFIIEDKWYMADITINGIRFDSVELKYDIYNDEVLANYYDKKIIVLNNENIDSFKLYIENRELFFVNLRGNDELKGHHELIYEGDSKLYRKWKKKRAQFVIEARYDEFQPDNDIIAYINNNIYPVKNRKRLLKAMDDKKSEIKSYIRQEKINIDFSNPETLIPVFRYYDTLRY